MVESDAQQYERLVGRLIDGIRHRVPTLKASDLRGGSKCRIRGASGFPHQIDVFVEAPNHIVLVECKHWKKTIGVQEVLVLSGRRTDIQASMPRGCRVEALFATTRGATSGAARLAKYFALDVGAVSSESEFTLRVANYVSVGVSDGIKATDYAEAEVVRGGRRLS